MTPAERVAYLVRLGMEAFKASAWTTEAVPLVPRDTFEAALTERMRDAAQVWTAEVTAEGSRGFDEGEAVGFERGQKLPRVRP